MSGLPLPWRIAANGAASLVLAFLVLPIFAVIPASFNKASYIRIPPNAYTTDWYGRFLADPEWKTALFNSLQVATLSTIVKVSTGVSSNLRKTNCAPSPLYQNVRDSLSNTSSQ